MIAACAQADQVYLYKYRLLLLLLLLLLSSESLFLMLDDLKFDKTAQKHIIRKMMNIAIRCSYYVFCRRNKAWNNPDLLDF